MNSLPMQDSCGAVLALPGRWARQVAAEGRAAFPAGPAAVGPPARRLTLAEAALRAPSLLGAAVLDGAGHEVQPLLLKAALGRGAQG